jgi:signal transduction histidine kinase
MPNIKKSDIYNKYRHILKTGEPLVIHQKLGDRSLAAQVFKLGDSLGIIVSDITERKRAEEERELVLAELAEKTKELEQVIYLTSHDLRSPLVNIQGFSKELDEALKKFYAVLNKIDIPPALRKKLASTMNGDLAKSLQYIIASSAKMDSLLSGLLKLSRMGRDTLRIKKLDMSKLISKVISSFEFQIKEVDATVKVEELPPCYGDETQIDQVFSNLVGNALKFLDPKRRGVIRVSGKEEKEQAVYCVEDNGIGIAEKDKDVIFGIFSKLDPDDKRGEGLGLTIVRKILDRHGGKVWVESEPGKGSKFYVSLPDISLSV